MHIRGWLALLALCAVSLPAGVAAQGVTTGAISGIVVNPQQEPVAGATVTAIHAPSGTVYEAVTRGDGRFSIQGMRVGGPYSVTVSFSGSGGAAFQPETQDDVTVNLGVATDLNFVVRPITVQEQVTVTAEIDPVFSSTRTGAATTVRREQLELLPTIAGRITDVTRMAPQNSTSGGFVGQDPKLNNITVDGSSFNATFGVSSSQPGDRTGVAPISLEAIEQLQVNVAPYDVRQGSFIGAGVNSVTRSGTNRLSGSFYHRFRSQDWAGTEAAGQPVSIGTFNYRNTGGWLSGPIIRNRWFAFGNYEDEKDTRPLISFRANTGGEPVVGSVTRVLKSDLDTLSSFLMGRFNYETGPYDGIDKLTPGKRFLVRSDYNVNTANKVSFRYNHLNSFTDTVLSGSTSAGIGRGSNTQQFLSFQNSNYQILENIRSGIGEWNMVIGNSMANSVQSGYTYQDESRTSRGAFFPFVDILDGAGVAYTSFGFEPFTANNELRYNTFQIQDNLTRFSAQHSWTFGGYAEKYHSDNVFFSCCPQSNYTYNSLADFYADANGYLASPNRAVAPVSLRRFKVRWSNLPGQTKPLQPLDVWYGAGYAQDEWRPARNVTVTGGVRFDVSRFKNTAYDNPNADALTFLDENGKAVQYDSGKLPDAKVLWSPRVGVNWDIAGDQMTQVRGGTGLFSGRPAYVWISNQLGNTGMLIGELVVDNTTAFPFTPDPDRYKPAATGAPASSYELDVSDPDFRFPQVWRSDIAVDRRLPLGIVSTTEFLFSKDVNGLYYINANLPAPQSSFAGVDNRPRWAGPSCATPTVGPCATRLNNAPGNQVTNAFVLKNGNEGRAWNFSQTLAKTAAFGLSVRGSYSYGESKNTVDPGSTASTNFSSISQSGNPNNPGLGFSMWSPGHRVFALATFTREYLSIGSTSISLYWEARNSAVGTPASSRLSYVFAGDMNGDSIAANDLIYIPRDTSEMNFATFTSGTRTFTAEEQAAAFERYIQQDPYLRNHRGNYAERNGVVLPMMRRADLSITQEFFRNVGGRRNGFEIRADFINFANFLNHNWGAGWRPVAAVNQSNQVQILTNPSVDAQGRANYRLALVNNELITNSFQTSINTRTQPYDNGGTDVYQFMISLRYRFN
jgi:Carboxypeptidase regulatory-like domain